MSETMRKKPEILAPVGGSEQLKAAVRCGADAVYFGLPNFNARRNADNFAGEGLADTIRYCHDAGVKVYLTINTLVMDEELSAMHETVDTAARSGADGIIVQDLAVASYAKKHWPDLPLHASTQLAVCNAEGARKLLDYGFVRVVLARELSLEEIALLRAETPKALELEAFVHGAMCMSYSGRCLISSFMNGRSGNRGECTQPCRWNYYLVEQKRPDEYFEFEEYGESSAILSSHDLNCIDFIDRIADAGVCSFKIEGRMKTAYYVATVVNAYRRRLDGCGDIAALQRELESVSHRPFSSGFYFGETVKGHNNDGLYRSGCKFAGVVVGRTEGGYLVQQRNRFRTGDILEIVSPDSLGDSFRVGEMLSSAGEPIDDAKLVAEVVTVRTDHSLSVGDLLRLRTEA